MLPIGGNNSVAFMQHAIANGANTHGSKQRRLVACQAARWRSNSSAIGQRRFQEHVRPLDRTFDVRTTTHPDSGKQCHLPES